MHGFEDEERLDTDDSYAGQRRRAKRRAERLTEIAVRASARSGVLMMAPAHTRPVSGSGVPEQRNASDDS